MKEPLKPIALEPILEEIEIRGFQAWLEHFLTKAFLEARKGKRMTYDEHEFEVRWPRNIKNLVQSIMERTYDPGSSIAFVIFEPMVREVFAAPFRDRSVHHFLFDLSAGWWDQGFIDTSTSCRAGKGTLAAIKAAQSQMLEVTDNCTKRARLVKLDLQGYFMSLSREKLYAVVKKGLNAQFAEYRGRESAERLLDTCKFLWRKILLDNPTAKAHKRGRKSNWDPNVLPPRKSLYMQVEGLGIVIGNLTSQLVSNIFLDQLDKFITQELGYKYYGRYVDDFYIMVPEEDYEKLKNDIKVIERFLKNELGLTLHPCKRYMQSVYKGMQFLGARIYPRCLYPSDRLQAKFRQAIYNYANGGGSYTTVVSYLGHIRHLDADGFVRKVFREVGWNVEPYYESKMAMRRPMEDLVEEMSGRMR